MPTAGPTVSLVQRVRMYVEPNNAFAEDHTGTLGDFEDIPIVEGSAQVTLTQETQNPQHVLQDLRDYQLEVLSKKSWSFTFSIPFHPTGTAATDGTAAVSSHIGDILRTIMGGQHLGTGTVVATGGWANSASGDVAAATGLSEGGILSWQDANGNSHARKIVNVTGSTVTVNVGFPEVPGSGETLTAGATYYWTQDPDTSLQFIVEGSEEQDRWLLCGGQGTFTINTPLDGSIPTLEVSLSGPVWYRGDETAGNLDSGAIGNATYSNYEPIPGHAGRVLVQTNGTRTYAGATVDVSEVSFQSAPEKAQITSPSGVEGVLRWRLTRAAGSSMSEGSFTTFFTGYGEWQARDNRTAKCVWYQNGLTRGRLTAIDAPTVQFVDVQRADAENIASETVNWRARKDGDSEATDDLATSPFRVHLG